MSGEGVPSVRALVDAGGGDDEVLGEGVAGDVQAGPGDDRVRWAGTVDGGPGADDIDGARTTVTYAARTAAIRATTGDDAPDGEAGEGDRLGPGVTTLLGGAGDDVLDTAGTVPLETAMFGGAGDDRLMGARGRDRLSGGPGDDVLLGEAGDDELQVDDGADVLRGGDGRDATSYGDSLTAVRVTVGDRAGDGEAGEGDDVGGDVERVTGGAGADLLAGDDGADELEGGSGADVLVGNGGDDRIDGALEYVGREATTIDVARDVIDAGPGRDIVGADGPDRVLLRDGERDWLGCLEGAPGHGGSISADAGDRVDDCAPVPLVEVGRVRADRRGRFALRVGCPAWSAIACRGELVLAGNDFARAITLPLRLAPGRSERRRVRLRPADLRVLRRRRSVAVDVVGEFVRLQPRSVQDLALVDVFTLLAPRR